MTPLAIANLNPAQVEFDQRYITASEIMKDLGITRNSLAYARANRKLPPAIVLNEGTLFVWERQTVQPYLDAWKLSLNVRRGIVA